MSDIYGGNSDILSGASDVLSGASDMVVAGPPANPLLSNTSLLSTTSLVFGGIPV
jgi:hypothetical protein